MSTKKSPLLLYAGIGLLVFALALSLLTFPLADNYSKPAGDFNDDGASDGTYSVVVSYRDIDGNLMSIMPFEFVQNGGAAASHILVLAQWEVSGFRVQWDTFAITVNFEMREYGISYDYEVLHAESKSGSGQTGSIFFEVYSTDLAEIDDGAEHNLNIWVEFVASVTDDKGVVIHDDDLVNEGGVMLTIKQSELNVAGTMTFNEEMSIVSFSAVDLGFDPTQNPAMATLVAGIAIVAVQLFMYRKR